MCGRKPRRILCLTAIVLVALRAGWCLAEGAGSSAHSPEAALPDAVAPPTRELPATASDESEEALQRRAGDWHLALRERRAISPHLASMVRVRFGGEDRCAGSMRGELASVPSQACEATAIHVDIAAFADEIAGSVNGTRVQIDFRPEPPPGTTGTTYTLVEGEVNYAAAPGGFAGSGSGVDCAPMIGGSLLEANDNEITETLRVGLVKLTPFTANQSIFECSFDPTSGETQVAEDFLASVSGAVDGNGDQTSATVTVSVE